MFRGMLVVSVTCVLTWAMAADARAQEPRALTIEATIGPGIGHTRGEYRGNDNGLALNVLAGLRITPAPGGAIVMGVSASSQGAGDADGVCVPADGGGCVPEFPGFTWISVLAGFETSDTAVRGLVGPAYVRSDESRSAAGVQARFDIAIPMAGTLAFMISTRAMLIPDYEGDLFHVYALGIGLRVR